MSDFTDVEQFAREHAACGGITPSASSHPNGGFMLILACACGTTLDRWVTIDEAKKPLPALPRPGAPRPAPVAAASPAAPTLTAPPAAPAAEPPTRPSRAPVAPAGADLEAAMREALEAEELVQLEPPAAAPPAPAAPSPASRVGARPAGAAPTPRPAMARLNLDTTIRTALTQQAELRLERKTVRTGTRVVWLILFALMAFGAAGILYLAVESDAPHERPGATAPLPPPLPPDRSERAALDEVMRSLRQLQGISQATTPLSVYSSRVLFAKTDVERFYAAAPPGPNRAAVREVLDVHLLAAAAWKARTLEQKELWEPVAQDPAIDLCPSVKRVVDFALVPENVPRAQSRGAAIAGAIPLLWECAGEKIAALDLRLGEEPPRPGEPAGPR